MNIHHIQPYAEDLNIGRTYNEACYLTLAGQDDWFVITDHDAMYLHPKSKSQVHDNIRKYGDTYDIFGCLTNRVSVPQNLYGGKMSDNPDVTYHRQIAERLHVEHYGEIYPTKKITAGFFLAFSKKVWEEHPFVENSVHLDRLFCESVLKSGGQIGIMMGVYMFHYYRFGAKRPQFEYDHLKVK